MTNNTKNNSCQKKTKKDIKNKCLIFVAGEKNVCNICKTIPTDTVYLLSGWYHSVYTRPCRKWCNHCTLPSVPGRRRQSGTFTYQSGITIITPTIYRFTNRSGCTNHLFSRSVFSVFHTALQAGSPHIYPSGSKLPAASGSPVC